MRSILCYGDSNTWGYDPETGERFGRDERWPGVLRARVGDTVDVIEAGLSGRTSAFDDPLDSNLNGLTFLPVCLATHQPIDVVVVFLGTNDVFLPAGITAHYAAQGVGALVDVIARSTAGPGGGPPKSLVVVPPPFAPLGKWEPWSPHGESRVRAILGSVPADGRGAPVHGPRPSRARGVEPDRRHPLRCSGPCGDRGRRGRGTGRHGLTPVGAAQRIVRTPPAAALLRTAITLKAATGRRKPFSVNSPAGSASTSSSTSA